MTNKQELVEAIKGKIHYVCYCSTCGKKYEATVDPFFSMNWDCESKICSKLAEKDFLGGGFFDLHPDREVVKQAENYNKKIL